MLLAASITATATGHRRCTLLLLLKPSVASRLHRTCYAAFPGCCGPVGCVEGPHVCEMLRAVCRLGGCQPGRLLELHPGEQGSLCACNGPVPLPCTVPVQVCVEQPITCHFMVAALHQFLQGACWCCARRRDAGLAGSYAGHGGAAISAALVASTRLIPVLAVTQARQRFTNHMHAMVNRVNTFNGVVYKNDPAILACAPAWLFCRPDSRSGIHRKPRCLQRWLLVSPTLFA